MEEIYEETVRQVEQYLIPEKALTESERPLDEAVRAIHWNGEGKIVSESLDGVGFAGVNLLFLTAARENAKTVKEPQVVEYQAGKLTVTQGEQGEYVWVRNNSTMAWKYTIWTDPKVSLGPARVKMTLTRRIDDKVQRTWVLDRFLEDFGFDAKPTFSR